MNERPKEKRKAVISEKESLTRRILKSLEMYSRGILRPNEANKELYNRRLIRSTTTENELYTRRLIRSPKPESEKESPTRRILKCLELYGRGILGSHEANKELYNRRLIRSLPTENELYSRRLIRSSQPGYKSPGRNLSKTPEKENVLIAIVQRLPKRKTLRTNKKNRKLSDDVYNAIDVLKCLYLQNQMYLRYL